MKRLFRLGCCFLIIAAFACVTDAQTPDSKAAALPTLFIAGDSTAARNNGNPIQGWGEPFADYFDPAKIIISNRAAAGVPP